MSLQHQRRAIGPTVNKLRQYQGRKRDGGVVGHWPRDAQILRISGFDATRLRPSDFIDIQRSQIVYLDVHGHNPIHGYQAIFYALSFRAADSPYTRRDTRLRGFLHYHVPIPARPLSGGLRFRCTPSLTTFAEGTDLLCRSGLPWTIPLVNLIRRSSIPVLQSLLRDNLVSFPDALACQSSFHHNLASDLPVVHAVGQPWALDLSAPSMVLIPGPYSLLRCEIYPAVAFYGSAIVCFEYTGNPDAPHEVAIRVLELRSNVAFRPEFAHLPPLFPGALLADPKRSPHTEPLPWTWNYDSHSARMAAALYALVHGPAPIPRSARDIAFTTDDLITAPALSRMRPDPGMPPDAEPAVDVYAAPHAHAPQIDMADTDLRMAPGVAYPSRRLRNKFHSWFYGQVPTREEIARYAGRG